MAFSFGGCQRHRRASFTTTTSAFFCIFVLILISFPEDVRAFHSSSMLVPSQVVSAAKAVPTSQSASNREQKGSKHKPLNLVPLGKAPNSNNKDIASNCLIPSQVKGVSMAKRQRRPQHQQRLAASSQDTSAAAPLSTQDANQTTKDSAASDNSNGNLKKHPRRRRQQQRPRGSATTANSQNNNHGQNGSNDDNSSSKTSSKKKKKNLRPPRTQRRHSRFGSLPDTRWYVNRGLPGWACFCILRSWCLVHFICDYTNILTL